ncbi:MAG: serine/threonine-protein kinase, partial [Egibacteraceae bacterium]
MPVEPSPPPLDGRYELLSELGRGGVGVVWRARDQRLRRDVAVKQIRIPGTVAEREQVLGRLMREGRAAARLNHPSVTTVYDVAVDGDSAYLIMELVSAPSLRDLVDGSGPLEPRRAAVIGLQLLGALEVAHRAGIVHRDVKPSNVMVPTEGPAKLADFGIAAVADDVTLTATGLVLGSPAYMAPEQASAGGSGATVDLWGLGATLFFAVEGAPPFDRGQPLATLAAVVHEAPPEPRQAGALAPVIAALLVKDPDQRADIAATRELLQQA